MNLHELLMNLVETLLQNIVAIMFTFLVCILYYYVAEMFGRAKFAKLSMIRQNKPSKLVLTINLLADLLICQIFLQNFPTIWYKI